jgi:hypothetical protein
MPAFFQLRNEREGQQFMVDLCILHVRTAPEAVQEMQTLRHREEPHLLSQEETVHEEEA